MLFKLIVTLYASGIIVDIGTVLISVEADCPTAPKSVDILLLDGILIINSRLEPINSILRD
jgi:hypothetical protein